MKRYFLDGDINVKNLVKAEDELYTTVEKTEKQYSIFTISPETQSEIYYQAFEEIVGYYHSQESLFLEFEKNNGFNLWFLGHFRLYYSYRNFLIRVAKAKAFLEKHPDSQVFTSETDLLSYMEDDRVVKIDSPGKSSRKNRLLKELGFLLFLNSKKPKLSSDVAIFSEVKHNKDGLNPKLAGLEDHYSRLLIREVFYRKVPAPTVKHPEGIAFSDRLMASYVRSFRWIGAIRAFNKALGSLRSQLAVRNKKESFMVRSLFDNKMSFFVYFLRFKAFQRWFAKNPLKGIVIMDENSPQQKVIQYAAKPYGIRVFAYQHGIFHDLHPAYMYGRYRQAPLLPDITFVWGKYYRDLLIKEGGFRPDQVAVAGKAGMDISSYQPSEKRADAKRIVLYASQPQPDAQLRKQQLKDVLECTKALQGQIELIVRPHPMETKDPFFEEVALEVGFHDYKFDGQASLADHMQLCDVLITSYSTVGAEFVPYRKPLLVLDYLKQDMVGYISQGVGIEITDGAALLEVLRQPVIPIDKNAYDHFLDQYFMMDDRPVAIKIKDEIDKRL